MFLIQTEIVVVEFRTVLINQISFPFPCSTSVGDLVGHHWTHNLSLHLVKGPGHKYNIFRFYRFVFTRSYLSPDQIRKTWWNSPIPNKPIPLLLAWLCNQGPRYVAGETTCKMFFFILRVNRLNKASNV